MDTQHVLDESAVDHDVLDATRRRVRDFLARSGTPGTCNSWMAGFDPAFSAALAAEGLLGMTVPAQWGGQGRGYAERYVVTEELLRAGAPVAYHWFADRQIAPTLLASGNIRLQEELLPRICRGELCVCIGISEPGAGSDVSAIASTARRDGDRWIVNGQKVWTSGAAHAQYCHLVVRSERHEDGPHRGLTEFVVPMDTAGITVRPINDLSGTAHFAEIFLDDVVIDDWRLVGTPGDAFRQISRQLDYERAGAERFLSTMPLLQALLRQARRDNATTWLADVGELLSRLTALRAMSLSVAVSMDAGAPPAALAALVKDLGAQFERDVVTLAVDAADDLEPSAELGARLREALLSQADYPLRGGTAEILREIVARRALGLGRST
jgi:alkylation response protein AidB-like acyl-CoA dehydrogenase